MTSTYPIAHKWYVLVSKGVHYKKAAATLEKLGYSFYLPLQRQLHYWSDRKKWIDVPIFNPYVFLFTNEQDRKLIFQSSSLFHFLTCEGRLAIAKEEEIEKIKLLCSNNHNIKLEAPPTIKKGDLIEVVNGPFSGMHGYAAQENGKYRFFVHISSLGQFASVELESSALKIC